MYFIKKDKSRGTKNTKANKITVSKASSDIFESWSSILLLSQLLTTLAKNTVVKVSQNGPYSSESPSTKGGVYNGFNDLIILDKTDEEFVLKYGR